MSMDPSSPVFAATSRALHGACALATVLLATGCETTRATLPASAGAPGKAAPAPVSAIVVAAEEAPLGGPGPARWRHLGRILQVERSDRLVLILADPVPTSVPTELFARDVSLAPTARLQLLAPRRSGVYAATIRDGNPAVGEEIVYEAPR